MTGGSRSHARKRAFWVYRFYRPYDPSVPLTSRATDNSFMPLPWLNRSRSNRGHETGRSLRAITFVCSDQRWELILPSRRPAYPPTPLRFLGTRFDLSLERIQNITSTLRSLEEERKTEDNFDEHGNHVSGNFARRFCQAMWRLRARNVQGIRGKITRKLSMVQEDVPVLEFKTLYILLCYFTKRIGWSSYAA